MVVLTGTVLGTLGALTKTTGAMGKISAAKYKGFTKSMGQFGQTMRQTTGLNFAMILNPLEALKKLLEPLSQLLEPVFALFEIFTGAMMEELMPAFQEFYEILFSDEMIALMVDMGRAWGRILTPAVQIFTRILQALIDSGVIEMISHWIIILTDYFMAMWDVMEPIIISLIVAWGEIIRVLVDLFMEFNLLEPLLLGLTALLLGFAGVTRMVLGAVERGLPIFQAMGDGLRVFYQAVHDAFSQILEFFRPVFEVVGGILMSFGQNVMNIFSTLLGNLINVFVLIFNAIHEPIQNVMEMLMGVGAYFVNMFTSYISQVRAVILAIARFFISIANHIVDAWNAIDIFNMAPLQRIPMLQGGGLIAQTGMAVVHQGEGVLNRRVLDTLDALGMAAGGPSREETRVTNVNIQSPVLLDEENLDNLARKVQDHLFLVGG